MHVMGNIYWLTYFPLHAHHNKWRILEHVYKTIIYKKRWSHTYIGTSMNSPWCVDSSFLYNPMFTSNLLFIHSIFSYDSTMRSSLDRKISIQMSLHDLWLGFLMYLYVDNIALEILSNNSIKDKILKTLREWHIYISTQSFKFDYTTVT